MSALDPRAVEVLKFWIDAGREAWFRKDTAFDDDFRNRFLNLHFAASRRELDGWMESAEGALALMILLDQFPRNCFRGSGHMYATDPLARYYARKALAAGYDRAVEPNLRAFFLLPFAHSENLADQHICVERSIPLGEEMLKHSTGHRDIIHRFGHFPHRNPMVGRETSPDEQAFLDAGGFAG